MPQYYLQLSLLKTWFMSILRRKKFLKGAWQKATYSKQQTSNQMPPPENTTKIQINLTQKKTQYKTELYHDPQKQILS